MGIMNFDTTRNPRKAYASMAVLAILVVAFPFFAQNYGNSWVRIADMALLYIMLALVVSSTVGIVSGWYPAARAARLDPVVALRAE